VTGKPWVEVSQTILHDPSLTEEQINSGRYPVGNCMQAAVASVLGFPLDAVPHFGQFMWWPQALELWLRGLGFTLKGDRTDTIPDRLCVVGGQSPRGVKHMVVGYSGEIVWDPHPSRAGLVAVTDVSWFDEALDTTDCWFCHLPWPTAEAS
jgi:hypothetical protein